MQCFSSVFHKMVWTPRELLNCWICQNDILGGSRIASQCTGKLWERSAQAAAKPLRKRAEAEDDTRGGEISLPACIINFTMPQKWARLVQKIWRSPAPEKQFIKQKPPLTQSPHLSSLPLSSLPLSPLFPFTRLNSKKWVIREKENFLFFL